MWAEGDHPAIVVDVGVVAGADRQQIVEVRAPAVPPPDDVMQLASVVLRGAARDSAACVQCPECSALRSIGESGRAAEVEFAGGMQHNPVSNDDGVNVGARREFSEYSWWDLDGKRPLGGRPIGARCIRVDDHDVLGPPRRTSDGVAGEQPLQCVSGEEILLLDRIAGTQVRDLLSFSPLGI